MNTLSGILNECGLVCPYDDELVCQLEEICHDFVESVDLKESEFADWVQCYCRGNYSSKVRTFVEKMAHDREISTADFPDCVWNALTFYVIYISIGNNDDDEQKAILSCSLQNQLLFYKGHWDSLIFQDYLVKLYYDFCDYLDKYKQGFGDVDMDFVAEIFDETITSSDVDDETLTKLKVMGKYTWLYKLEHFWDNKEFSGERNAFLKVLYFLDYCYKEIPSIYICVSLKKMLELSGAFKSVANKSLRGIISDILALEKDFFDVPISKSSIILKMINESYIYEEVFVDEKLSPAEFFVYLYYEVLLELKLKENGGE